MGQDEKNTPVVYIALGDSTGVGVGARDGKGYVARLFERFERERPGSCVVKPVVDKLNAKEQDSRSSRRNN